MYLATAAPLLHILVIRERAPDYGSDEPDRIEDLGDRIATLAAHIHAATERLLGLIEEFDRLRGWERSGHRDCADWLSDRTGIERGAAQEKVRAARALVGLPLTRAAMAKGELSFTKVRALTRVATGDNEAELVTLARGVNAFQLERIVRAWKRTSRQDEVERERQCVESRAFSVFPDDEGMYVVKGRLTPEVAAAFMRAIEAAADAIFRDRGMEATAALDPDRARKAAAQRRADAIGFIAERALAAGFDQVSGSRAERYQVVIHVDADTLSADREPGRSELQDGTRLSAESARRLACDASVVRVAQNREGAVLGVGRKTRTISPALRRALESRDRGCRFPGCGRGFTDAHHVKHWADGGETSLGNTLLLCRHHHALVHEGGWTLGWDGDKRPLFFDPRGGMHYDGRWQPTPLPSDAVETLEQENRIEPDGWTGGVLWKRERDIPEDVLLGAYEALA